MKLWSRSRWRRASAGLEEGAQRSRSRTVRKSHGQWQMSLERSRREAGKVGWSQNMENPEY